MDAAEGTRLTKHQRHWLEQIQACEASGKSVAAYASEHGFPVRAMYDAKKALVKKGVFRPTSRRQSRMLHRSRVLFTRMKSHRNNATA